LKNGLWDFIDDKGNEVIPNIYTEVSEFTEDLTKEKVAFVKAFHPLAENNIRELYINEKDEIIDARLIETKKKRPGRRFS